MQDMKLEYICIDEFKKDIYSYYSEIFPDEERKSLELLKSSYEKRIYKNCKNTI